MVDRYKGRSKRCCISFLFHQSHLYFSYLMDSDFNSASITHFRDVPSRLAFLSHQFNGRKLYHYFETYQAIMIVKYHSAKAHNNDGNGNGGSPSAQPVSPNAVVDQALLQLVHLASRPTLQMVMATTHQEPSSTPHFTIAKRHRCPIHQAQRPLRRIMMTFPTSQHLTSPADVTPSPANLHHPAIPLPPSPPHPTTPQATST